MAEAVCVHTRTEVTKGHTHTHTHLHSKTGGAGWIGLRTIPLLRSFSYGSHDVANLALARMCVCACLLLLEKQVHDQAARAWCVAVAFECAGKYVPRGGESTSAGATRGACVACIMRQRSVAQL